MLVLGLTLFAGLHPRDYRFENRVRPAASGLGLRFERYGVAWTDAVLGADLVQALNAEGFEIRIALGPEAQDQTGFAIVAQVHAGDDSTQLVIGRWSDHLIVMNGDDYENRDAHPRITTKWADAQRAEGLDLLVRSTRSGSEIHVGGERVAARADVRLTLPSSPERGRIVLGNSVAGDRPWSGEMRAFVLRPAHPSGAAPLLRYRLAEYDSGEGPGEGELTSVLTVPHRRVVMDGRLLELPSGGSFAKTRSFVGDVALNLIGFVPLGMMWVLVDARSSRSRRLRSAFLVAAALGLSIEASQAWIPSRDSSALDWVLNTLGGGLGGFVATRVGPRGGPPAEGSGEPALSIDEGSRPTGSRADD